MFVRRVRVKNSICFQIGRKSSGRFVLTKHIGCAPISSEPKVAALRLKAQSELARIKLSIQPSLFSWGEPPAVKASLVAWRITGFHRVFGIVYDTLGFPATLLRDLVIGRIVYPKSKLATVNYFRRYLGISLTVDIVYRFLDTLDKYGLARIAFNFVSGRHRGISLVFYDVTTLHFETEVEDELRKKGYSKNRRADVPQVVVGLFVDADGYPFDFDMFPGNTFEGHTFEIAVNRLRHKYHLGSLTVVADAAMLSADNLDFLESQGFGYIVGARLKNLPRDMIKDIIGFDFSGGGIYSTEWEGRRLLVDFSAARAQRDAANRDRQVKKLKLALASNRPVIRKSKYLRLDSPNQIRGIDRAKIAADRQFDGLKGYVTNPTNRMADSQVVSQYRNLWKIERAFRMSKTDLKQRPVYHRLRRRIKAHLTLCFVSLLVAKETERILGQKHYSLETAIEILGRVGSGKTRIDNVELDIESELDDAAKSILELFEGH